MKTHHFDWKAHSFTQALPMPCRRHIIFHTFQKMNFPGKHFFLSSTPSERCPACVCSCLQPQRILQPNIHIPQGRVLQGTNPKPILASAREKLHHGCWECSQQALPAEASGMLAAEGRVPKEHQG